MLQKEIQKLLSEGVPLRSILHHKGRLKKRKSGRPKKEWQEANEKLLRAKENYKQFWNKSVEDETKTDKID